MSEPSEFATKQLRDRSERLVTYLDHKLAGENVPIQAIDEAVELVDDAVDRWRKERNADGN